MSGLKAVFGCSYCNNSVFHCTHSLRVIQYKRCKYCGDTVHLTPCFTYAALQGSDVSFTLIRTPTVGVPA